MTDASIPPGPVSSRATIAVERWPLIDAARGAAIVAMIIYHFSWDLHFHGLIATDIARHPAWSSFAASIAASFLMLVGAGFALGARGGLDRSRYLRRLAIIAGAATLVTLGTAIAMPHAPVLFGILHCIALSSVFIAPFLRAPIAIAAAAAIIVFVLPSAARSPRFDGAAWTWLGLADRNLPSVDHVPMLPWFGFVLVGLAAARALIELDALTSLRAVMRDWRAASRPTRLLIAMGRWSLVIYLTHQLVLNALIWPFAPPVPQRAEIDDASSFRSACEQSCKPTGGVDSCRAFCACAIDKLRPTPLWANILRDNVTPDLQSKIADVTKQCAPAAAK